LFVNLCGKSFHYVGELHKARLLVQEAFSISGLSLGVVQRLVIAHFAHVEALPEWKGGCEFAERRARAALTSEISPLAR
jgi:hypothetical protein